MTYYLDTNICINIMRGKMPRTYEMILGMDANDIKIASVVAGELYYGAEHSRNPQSMCADVDAFVAPFEVVPFDGDAAREYARIRHQLATEGQLIGGNDMLIAATARARGGTVVTFNRGEFDRIRALSVETWDESAA